MYPAERGESSSGEAERNEEHEAEYKDQQCKLQEQDQEIQSRLQNTEKKNEGLQVIINEAFQKYAQLEKEKEEKEAKYKDLQGKLYEKHQEIHCKL